MVTKKGWNKGNYIHGGSYTKLFQIWCGMRRRCSIKNVIDPHLYYKKGIRVCDEWINFKVFRSWALKNGYEIGLSIDRVKNDLGYNPKNCRWVPKSEQGKNTSRIVYVSGFGELKSVSEWARDKRWKFCREFLRRRLNQGYSLEELFSGKNIDRRRYRFSR